MKEREMKHKKVKNQTALGLEGVFTEVKMTGEEGIFTASVG